MTNCTIGNSTTCSLQAEYVIYVYIFSTICYAGLILNTLNMIVFARKISKPKRKQPVYLMLNALAAFDFCALVLFSGIWICRCIPINYPWEVNARSYYETYLYMPVSNTFGTASVFLTVRISIERCICIRNNNFYKKIYKKHTVKLGLVVCFVLALGLNIPFFLYREVDDEGEIVKTEFGNSDGYQTYQWVRLMVGKVIPLVIIIICNTILVVTVILQMRQATTVAFTEASQLQRHRQQIRLTVMMISISLMLVICHCMEPFIHDGIAVVVFGPCSIYTDAFKVLSVVVNTLEVLSYTTNFVFYCAFNDDFRRGLDYLLCCCLSNKIEPDTSES